MPIFGYRAAAPALLCNDSYYNNSPMFWDPEKMQLIKKYHSKSDYETTA
jgi:hypothetical protein